MVIYLRQSRLVLEYSATPMPNVKNVHDLVRNGEKDPGDMGPMAIK